MPDQYHTYIRAAAASLLSLKAEGATLEVVTSVKRPPGIVEVCSALCTHFQFDSSVFMECQHRLA